MSKQLFYIFAYISLLMVHIIGQAFDHNYKKSKTCMINDIVIFIIVFFQIIIIDWR